MSETTPKVVGLGGKGYDPKAFHASAGTKVLYSVPKSSDKFFRTPYNNIAGLSPDGVFADYVAPVITGPTSISVNENTTPIHVFSANETVTWSKSGADTSKFTLNSSTGELVFASAPDYETPTDADGNNIYQVVITATDTAGNASSQTLDVTVLDVDEFVSSNLRMHLDADSYSGSGDWLDATSNDNDGTIVGATFVAASGSDPAYFDFDGSNDRVDVTDTYSGGTAGGLATYDLMNGSNNWSLNIWFNTDSFPSGTSASVAPILFLSGWRNVLSVHGDFEPVDEFHLRRDQGGWGSPVSSGTLSTGTWYNVCVTYNSSSGYVLYLNGSSVDTSTATGTISLRSSSSNTNIGGETNLSGNRSYNGQIAVMSLYEKTLASSEVTLNYNVFKTRYGY